MQGDYRQVIHDADCFRLRSIDARQQPDQDTLLEQIYYDERTTPFELDRPPLLRVTLVALADDRAVLVLTSHHVILDGWSEGILYRELAHLYEAYRRGAAPTLPPLRIQYKDYAAWHNALIELGTFDADLEYFRRLFAAGVPSAPIQTDRPRPKEFSYHGDILAFHFAQEWTDALRELATRTNVSLFMLSFSALASARISLRMLLSHSAGLADHEELFGARGPAGLAQYVRERITPDLLVAEPGKVFSYSSPGLDLAGYIAEVVSGTPYPELMRQLVFEPLEMSRTLFDPLVAMTYPVALGHDLLEDGSVRVQHRFAENSGQYPSSFALSTALDLANFGALHLGGGSFRGTRILSGDLVAEMQRRQVETYTPWGDGYGLAFVTETHKGVRRVKQGGMIGSFGSLFVLAPERQIGFVALYNLTEQLSLNALEAYLFDALLGLPAEFPLPAPIEPDRELWQRYTGAYTRDGRVVRVAIGDDGLTIQGSRHPLPLIAFGESRYHNQEYGINVGFVPEAAGPVNYMMVNGEIYARAASDEAQSTEDRSDG